MCRPTYCNQWNSACENTRGRHQVFINGINKDIYFINNDISNEMQISVLEMQIYVFNLEIKISVFQIQVSAFASRKHVYIILTS